MRPGSFRSRALACAASETPGKCLRARCRLQRDGVFHACPGWPALYARTPLRGFLSPMVSRRRPGTMSGTAGGRVSRPAGMAAAGDTAPPLLAQPNAAPADDPRHQRQPGQGQVQVLPMEVLLARLRWPADRNDPADAPSESLANPGLSPVRYQCPALPATRAGEAQRQLRRLRVSADGDCILRVPVSYDLQLGYSAGEFHLNQSSLTFAQVK